MSARPPVRRPKESDMTSSTRPPARHRSERGDVPGWVLITVMTAGLVAALWAIAGPQLAQLLRDALSSVS
jgi:hypothetical protein